MVNNFGITTIYSSFCFYNICGSSQLLRFFHAHEQRSKTIVMDIEYTWILIQGNTYRQYNLLTWNSYIDQYLHSLGGEWMG